MAKAKKEGGTAALDPDTGEPTALEQAIKTHGKAAVARELQVAQSLLDRWRTGDATPTDEEQTKLQKLAEVSKSEPRDPTEKELALVTRLRALAGMTQSDGWIGDLMPFIRAQVAAAERSILDDARGGDLERLRGRRDAYQSLLGYVEKQAKELDELPLFTGKVRAKWDAKEGVLTVSELKATA